MPTIVNADRDAVAKAADRTKSDDALKLRRFLEAYWLRPENALWMTLRSHCLSQAAWATRSADICCGDGLFTFLHLGGYFDPAFDVFCSVGSLDRVTDGHADMFDHVTDDYAPPIVTAPNERVHVGTDLKDTLLAKARSLGLYERTLRHDSNAPLPIEDASFATVYCNSAYWVANIDVFLRELARIVQPGGQVILHVKMACMRRYTLASSRAVLGDRMLDLLGRGRVASWPTLADRRSWEDRFTRAGLAIESATPFITRTHAHLWDVGLRPIAPLLVRMTAALNPETRLAIKRDWVDLFLDLLTPLCDPDLDLFPGHDEPAEVQYVLSPHPSAC